MLIVWMIADTVGEAKAKKRASVTGDGAGDESAPDGEIPESASASENGDASENGNASENGEVPEDTKTPEEGRDE